MRAFISTWCCYAGFYFCRKAFYITKGELTVQLGFDSITLGQIGTAYLIAYAFGEFNAAALGYRLGPRRLLLSGMAISALCNIFFGFANNQWTFMAFMALNGLAQATGWSGNVGTMAQWFRRKERGQVMAIWSTCYQIGGVLANGFAAFMLGWLGFRWSFWGASLVLCCVWWLFYFLQRNKPEDVGLPALEDDNDLLTRDSTGAGAAAGVKSGFNAQLVKTILLMGLFYFFVKFIRYALWSWSPYFLQLNYGLAKDSAGYYSTLFDIFGFFGVLSAGFISDRLFQGRRVAISFLMMLGLTLCTMLMWFFGPQSLTLFAVTISLTGFMLYGPDSLLTGAGAIDVGSRKYAIVAAGIINGMGSCGSVVQELAIGSLYKNNPSNLSPIFGLLIGSSIIATVLVFFLLLRARAGKCNL